MNYPAYQRELTRLAILEILATQPVYRANTTVMTAALRQTKVLTVTRDQVESDCAWLAEQGLLTREELDTSLVGITLTRRGEDVALGRARHPGVARPEPGL